MSETSIMTDLREKAMTLTARINANGRIAAGAIYEMARDLRTMKIEKLYTQLDYVSFEDYAEQEFGIGRRQAYSYISVYEKLGEEFVQSNSQLGITKLTLLTQLDSTDRSEIVAENDIAGMTVDEVQELINKVKIQGEQLSMFEAETNKLRKDGDRADAAESKVEEQQKKIDELLDKIEDLEENVAEKNVPEIHEIEKVVPDKKALAQKDREYKALEDKYNALESSHANELEKLKAEYEEKLSVAQKESAEKVNVDKNSFKVMYADAYKAVSGLISFITSTTEQADRQLYIEKTKQLLSICSDSLEKAE